MVDFNVAINAAGQAISMVKQLVSAQQALSEAEWKLKVAEITGSLADVKNALLDAKEESKKKDEELASIKTRFKAFNETVEIDGFRYDKTTEGRPVGHAYCPVCIQKESYMFHLTEGLSRHQFCPNCKANYVAQDY